MARQNVDFEAIADMAARVWSRAQGVDEAGALPLIDIADLDRSGLLEAVVPEAEGRSLVNEAACLERVLRMIGSASLTVGRLYEGHVNAARLIGRYGSVTTQRVLAGEAAAGRLLGVWNAERDGGPVVRPVEGGWCLSGRKIHCSGAGHIRRPIVTARDEHQSVWMLLPDLERDNVRADTDIWRALGMRGTATATVDFDDVFVSHDEIVGNAGDYYRSPLFSGGAWRVLAVQLGGLERILALHAERLQSSGRSDDAIFRARFATAAADYESARLLVEAAGQRAEDSGADAEAINAYVDQARGAFERFALAIIATTRLNVGLSSFIAPDPLDRCLRDLETYLRQPFIDASRDSAAQYLLPRKGVFQ